jgi:multiple sugar transport system permease protein
MAMNTRRTDLRNGLLFVSPWIVGFLVFQIYPLLQSFYFSLSDYSVLNPPVFIGFSHYADIASDKLFWISMYNTAIYAVLSLPLGAILSLAIAILLNQNIKGRTLFRAIVFIPSLIPLVAMGVVWRGIFNGDYGVLNYLLSLFGIEGINWLGNEDWMIPALVLTGLWGIGNTVVIYLAGLQDVPRHLYEAADIDGASWWQKTIYITLPSISPVIYFNVMVQTIFVLQVFIVPYILFEPDGGAGRAGLYYTMHILNQGFTFLKMGYACAMAWILFIFIAILTYATHKLTIKHVHYGG